MTPLGGTPEGSSHKGYGLGAMVNILSLGAVGRLHGHRPDAHAKRPATIDIGHFFLAIDPGMFRDTADFRADVAAFCDTLRATKPVDPAKPVQVAGDPERRIAAAAPEDRHPRRPEPAGQGARDRARLRRALDHRQLRRQQPFLRKNASVRCQASAAAAALFGPVVPERSKSWPAPGYILIS